MDGKVLYEGTTEKGHPIVIRYIKKSDIPALHEFANIISKEQLIGYADIVMKEYTEKFIGVLGIILTKEFRGEGLGSLMMQVLLDEAKKNLTNLRQITLQVMNTNHIAIDWYTKLGFVEYGRLPKSAVHRGEFVDWVYMYKQIKE